MGTKIGDRDGVEEGLETAARICESRSNVIRKLMEMCGCGARNQPFCVNCRRDQNQLDALWHIATAIRLAK